jgi:hypothetical protein
LNDRSKAATTFVKQFLQGYSTGKVIDGITVPSGIGSDPIGNLVSKKAFTHAGLAKIYAGSDAAHFMATKSSDNYVPDVIGIAQQGSVYGGGSLSKIAEHGGDAKQDRHVPIVAWGPGLKHGKLVKSHVETTQIAPTILHLLGLNPKELQAVKAEKTSVLPGL